MPARTQPIHVRISGPLALFTRPEMKVERVSYDFITPSAARGVLEAILWKPAMRWVVQRIRVLKPIRFVSLKRNEVASKIPSDMTGWMRKNEIDRAFFADDDRQQRNAVVLYDVAYVVTAAIELTSRAGPGESTLKFFEMFHRRLEKGQHFHQPYLGCREFPASVALADGTEVVAAELQDRDVDLGWMLHDIAYSDEGPVEPRFFQALVRSGMVEVPEFGRGVRA